MKKQNTSYVVAMLVLLASTCVLAKESRSFLTARQKSELIWKGQVTSQESNRYDMFIIPGYAGPGREVKEGWSDGGDRLLDYFRPKPYRGIAQGFKESKDWSRSMMVDFIGHGIRNSWKDNFRMANQARERGAFAWYLTYPYAFTKSLLSSVMRVGGGTVGVAAGAVYAVGLRPAYEFTSPVIRSALNISVRGTAYPVTRMAWNTLLAPPLSLVEFEPTPTSADGFWVRRL